MAQTSGRYYGILEIKRNIHQIVFNGINSCNIYCFFFQRIYTPSYVPICIFFFFLTFLLVSIQTQYWLMQICISFFSSRIDMTHFSYKIHGTSSDRPQSRLILNERTQENGCNKMQTHVNWLIVTLTIYFVGRYHFTSGKGVT